MLNNINNRVANLFISIIYLLFFLILFLQFPLNNSLPQNIDTWYNISVFQNFYNEINSFISGEEIGLPLYPYKNCFNNGDPTFGISIIYNIIYFIIHDTLWSYYLLISIIYALNAFAVFLLIGYFVKDKWASFFGGFVFSASNFSFALLDNPNAIFIAFVFFSGFLFLRYLDSKKTKYFIFASLLGGFSIHVCSYSVMYIPFLIVCISFIKAFEYKTIKVFIASFFYFIIFLLFLIPILLYLKGGIIPESKDFYDILAGYSIHLNDFFRAIQGNLILNVKNDLQSVWQNNVRSIYIGFTVYLLSFYFVFNNIKLIYVKYFTGLFFIVLILSFGAYFQIGEFKFKAPLFYIYEFFPLSLLLKSTSRFFLLNTFILSLFAAGCCSMFFDLFKNNRLIFIILLFVFFLENIPLSFQKFNSSEFIMPPNGMIKLIDKYPDAVIAHLPSRLSFTQVEINNELNTINREIIYIYWSTILKNNTVNGFNFSLISSRYKADTLLNNIQNDENLKVLVEKYDVNFIILHKDFILPNDSFKFEYLSKSVNIKKIYEDMSIIIYQPKDSIIQD